MASPPGPPPGPSVPAAADDLLSLLDEPEALATPPAALPPWRVLMADDDADVHRATDFALRGLSFGGRAVTLLHADSAAQAYRMLADDPDIAVLLLDVVMETPDAGLRLVARLRGELGRTALRIVLRTGQPGYAPAIETLREHDIDDYRTKAELTRERLFASLTVALRSYELLSGLIRQRDELADLNRALEAARAAEREAADRRLQAERALREVRDEIDRAVEQRTRVLATEIAELESFNRMVSHDLRGPLHGLADLSSIAQADLARGRTAELSRRLGLLGDQARRLAYLVTDLMGLARVSSGELAWERVELADVVAAALDTLALSHDVARLDCISVGALPAVTVDRALMGQVFVNLLANALRFSRDVPCPQVQVQAQALDDAVLIEVRDNGVGFDSSRADDLFKPFVRLHGGAFPGSGIGLTIVQRIVTRHGGEIRAHGRPGQGACFSVRLPLGARASAAA